MPLSTNLLIGSTRPVCGTAFSVFECLYCISPAAPESGLWPWNKVSSKTLLRGQCALQRSRLSQRWVTEPRITGSFKLLPTPPYQSGTQPRTEPGVSPFSVYFPLQPFLGSPVLCFPTFFYPNLTAFRKSPETHSAQDSGLKTRRHPFWGMLLLHLSRRSH